MVVLALYLADLRSRQAEREVEQKALATAKAAAAHYSELLALGRKHMERLAPSVAGQVADRRQCDDFLGRALALQPLFKALYAASKDGNLECAAPALSQVINVADRPYFQRAHAQRAFVVSDILQSRRSGDWVIVAAGPMPGAEHVLLGTLDLSWLQLLLENYSLPEHSFVAVIDESARIVARVPFDPSFIGRMVPEPEQFAAMKLQDSGVLKGVSFEGFPMLVAYSRVPGHSVFIRVGLPVSVVDDSGREVLVGSALIIAIAVALALLAGSWAFRTLFVQPVGALTRAAEKLGAGDLSARTGVPHDESLVGGLARKLDDLATHGQRVSRALRTLSAGNQTLLRERNEQELLHAMCRVAVERGGYAAAYVCFPIHDEGKSVQIVARQGDDGGFMTTVPLSWGDSPGGQGSVGRCIRTGERAVVRIADDANATPWKTPASELGFGSVISLPLRVQGSLCGTFTLLSRGEDTFDQEELTLLDEMAADLSFGIEVIRAEARRKEAEHIARRALTHDTTLDMPNRTAFMRMVNDCLVRGRANHEPVAVLDVHVGGLQDVFDSFGHTYGNAALRQIAERLQKLPECEGMLARLPSDDFGVVLCSYDAEAASRVAHRLLAVFDDSVRIGDARIDLRASVGATFYPGHGEEPEILVRRASIAARNAFRRELPYQVYAGAMRSEDRDRLSLAVDLRAGIEARELTLHYQPKVRLADGAHTGAEALVRWHHPERGPISPAHFVTLAEEIGLIRSLTYQVLDMAVRQQHEWLRAAPLPVAINLSARNLYDPTLFQALDGFFGTWGLPRDLVHFEITESALVDDPDAARRALERLRDLGARIYIDDFGTGYSSLNYLVRLPVHALKIDRSFIQQMTKSEQARSVVSSVISMAHSLRMSVVAEGVETQTDAEVLRAMGCDEAQGYLFSKPLPPAQYAEWAAGRPRA